MIGQNVLPLIIIERVYVLLLLVIFIPVALGQLLAETLVVASLVAPPNPCDIAGHPQMFYGFPWVR